MGKVILEILDSEGCAKCVGLKDRVKEVLNELNSSQIELKNLDLFDNQERIVQLGIYTSPALAVNGKLYFIGTIPSKEDLKNIILKEIGTD